MMGETEMFENLTGVANWLNAKNPKGGVFYTYNGERRDYEITEANLQKVINESEKMGLAASISIIQDFFVQDIESQYILSKIKVNKK